MADISLIFPRSPFLIKEDVMPPLGILYLASALKIMDFNVQCLDLGLGHTTDMVKSNIVGVSITSPQKKEAFEIARKLKREGKTTIAGGPHATHDPEECKANGFDYVFRGEADTTLPIFLYYKQKGKHHYSSPIISCEEVHFIDSFPFPDRDALPIKNYHYKIDGKDATVIMTSRGCPYTCLRGDTIIHTIEGDFPIKELVGKKTKVLTRDPLNHEPVFADVVDIRRTKRNAKLVRVHFDDGSHIDCTPDHKFMTFKNGNQFVDVEETETQAKDLKSGQSVRAVRFELNKRTRQVLVSTKRNIGMSLHKLVMEALLNRKLKPEEIIHHEDHDRTNNLPNNLKLATKYNHISNHHPEVAERMRTKNPSFGKPKEYFVELGKKQRGAKRNLESRLQYRESKLGEKNPRYNPNINHDHQKRSRIQELHINHKIKFVEVLSFKEDVYCMEVPGYSWFYANRVLVHNCSFCAKSTKKFRMQSAERTVDEILHINDRYGFEAFMIFDDVFISDRNRLASIISLLSARKFTFRCFGRANLLTEEVCLLLKQLGVVEVGVGIESGSNEVLKRNMKGTTREMNLKAVMNLRKNKIRMKAFLIVGLPGETEKTVRETESWIKEARPDDLDISIFQPLPGSMIYNNPSYFSVEFVKEALPFKSKPGEYKTTVRGELSPERMLTLREELENKYKKMPL